MSTLSPAQIETEKLEAKTDLKRAERFFYPIAVDLRDRKVLVVGGSQVALNEVERLLDFGAQVDVVAPNLMAEFSTLVKTYGQRVNLKKRQFNSEDSELFERRFYILVYALSDEDQQNLAVLAAAKRFSVLAFAAEQISQSSFVAPATFKRGHLKFSVSADGFSPPLEKALLQRIEAALVNDMDKYVLFLSSIKERVIALVNSSTVDSSNAKSILRQLADSEELLLALKRQSFDEANMVAEQIVNDSLVSSGT